ncbi:MAG: helix-turn-helix domain-containing protein [Oscillatoriaceae cyanobacterium Prado104]|jgi:DNA-binding XRE family transcriptional regulator|nr:helix-turn-helix domain-containing protein [Oscillatoriaceae cyanobacterium Prado104]
MDEAKRQRLETAGWTVGTVEEFLGLSPEETAFIEMKIALSKAIKQNRISQQMTQHELAKRIKSSQSRVAKMEAGDPSASLDLLIRTLLTFGATRQDIAEVILRGNS